MSNLEKLYKYGIIQHGIFAAYQLKGWAINRNNIYHLLRSDKIKKVSRGVYCLEGFEPSWHQNAIISVFKSGPSALLSHESALINLELLQPTFLSHRGLRIVDFHATMPRTSSRRNIKSEHRSVYPHIFEDQIIVNGIAQVSVENAITESAKYLNESFLSSVVDSAIRNNFTSPQKLKENMDKLWPAPGRSKIRLDDLVSSYKSNTEILQKTESTLESRILRIILEEASDMKVCPQYKVFTGGKQYRIDIAIPEIKLAVEVDSFMFHRSRDEFDRDRFRQNSLVIEGWTFLRITAKQSNDEIRSIIRKTFQSLGVFCITG